MRIYPIVPTLLLAVASQPAAAQTVAAPGGFVPQQSISFGASGTPAIPVDAAHPLPVAARGSAVTYADVSGTIATGNIAQQIAVARTVRQGFFIQNLSSADLWINMTGPATADQPSLRIAPGQLYESPSHGVPAGAISVLGASAGQSFSAREW